MRKPTDMLDEGDVLLLTGGDTATVRAVEEMSIWMRIVRYTRTRGDGSSYAQSARVPRDYEWEVLET